MNQIYEQHKRSEANKALNSDLVTKQRELLIDFAAYWNKHNYEFMNDFHIDEFMKENKL